MLTFLKLFLLMFFVSCSSIEKPSYFVESEFQDDFESFIVDADRYDTKIDVRGLKIIMVDLYEFNTGLAGYCDIPTKTVMIFRTWFKNMTPLERKYLLYHELGHCLLLRMHSLKRITDMSQCYGSIMYPDAANYCFNIFEENYIQELFTNPDQEQLFSKEPFGEPVYK